MHTTINLMEDKFFLMTAPGLMDQNELRQSVIQKCMKAEKYIDWHTTDTVYVVIFAPAFNEDPLFKRLIILVINNTMKFSVLLMQVPLLEWQEMKVVEKVLMGLSILGG